MVPKYDVSVEIDLHGHSGNAHAVAAAVEGALEVLVGAPAAGEFREEFLKLIKDEATDYKRVLSFCEEWVKVQYK